MSRSQQDDIAHSLLLSTAVVHVLFEGKERLLDQVAGSHFEESLSLLELMTGKLEPGAEVASCKVFLIERSRFLFPVTFLGKLKVLRQPSDEVVTAQAGAPRLQHAASQYMLVL